MRYVSRQNLYNPHEQTPKELIEGFVTRVPLFNRLYQEITNWEDTIQHYLIEGKRGMGKTSLLLRLCYEIDTQKPANIIGLPFKEEAHWRINRLHILWEETARILGEKDMRFAYLYDKMTTAYNEQIDYEKVCCEMLLEALEESNQNVVLFIDNLGELFRNFNLQENQRLREVLHTTKRLRLVGGTALISEFFFDYNHPFYEFFKIIHLKPLGREDTIALMRSLGKIEGSTAQIDDIINKRIARLETMRLLTGGVTRTLVLLYDILSQDVEGKALLDLERILDEVTPLYQDRLNHLKPTEKTIIDKIAFAWDSISIEGLATQLRQKQTDILPALRELEKMDIIERVETITNVELYNLQERFFNIWYLMRMSGSRMSDKVVWLVQFMNAWYENQEQLNSRLAQHLIVLDTRKYTAKHAALYFEAFVQINLMNEALKDILKLKTLIFFEAVDPDYIQQISLDDLDLLERGKGYWIDFQNGGEIDDAKSALRYLLYIKNKDAYIEQLIGHCYENLKEWEKVIEHYQKAYKLGNYKVLVDMARVFYETEDYENAKHYYVLASENGDSDASHILALLFSREGNKQEMEKYYRIAIAQGNKDATFNFILSFLLHNKAHLEEAKVLAENFYQQELSSLSKFALAMVYATLDMGEKADSLFIEAKNDYGDKDFSNLYNTYLFHLIVHNQYPHAQAHFEREEGILKDKLKPLYYAFLKLSGNPDYLKMPPEIGEVVEGIIKEIGELRERFA